jgi:hypothetical protein
VILSAIARVSTSEFALRLLAAVGGIAVIPAV